MAQLNLVFQWKNTISLADSPTLHLFFLFTYFLPSNIIHFCLQSIWRFCGHGKTTNTHPKRFTRLYRKLARIKKGSTDKLPCHLAREARRCPPSPAPNFSCCLCPPMLNHGEKEEGTSAIGWKFSNPCLVYKKNK